MAKRSCVPDAPSSTSRHAVLEALSPAALSALGELGEFVAEHHGEGSYTSLAKHGRWNIVNRLAHLLGGHEQRGERSVLAFGMWLQGLDYRPACDRATTYEDDLNSLYDLYVAGKSLRWSSLKDVDDTRKLYNRAKKRAGGRTGSSASWSSVYAHTVERFGPLDWRRFLSKLPPGMFELPDGEVVIFEGVHQGRSNPGLL